MAGVEQQPNIGAVYVVTSRSTEAWRFGGSIRAIGSTSISSSDRAT